MGKYKILNNLLFEIVKSSSIAWGEFLNWSPSVLRFWILQATIHTYNIPTNCPSPVSLKKVKENSFLKENYNFTVDFDQELIIGLSQRDTT